MDLPYGLGCPKCTYWVEVSEEDADASLSELSDHIFSKHAGYRRDVSMRILAGARELTAAQAARR